VLRFENDELPIAELYPMITHQKRVKSKGYSGKFMDGTSVKK